MNDTLKLTGGRPLRGGVVISGFKHALVPMMAASVISDGVITISNAPEIEDMRVVSEIIRSMGGLTQFDRGVLSLDTRDMRSDPVPTALAERVHGSLYLVPVLLARFGRAEIGMTGGCQIGEGDNGRRPTSHIVSVLERFGATFTPVTGGIAGQCDRLVACEIDIHDYAAEIRNGPSGPLVSGATKTAILAAATARGTSIIRHPYRKIDVAELVGLLCAGGIPIHKANDSLVVEGQERVKAANRSLPSDLIEVVTYVAASVYLGGDIALSVTDPASVMEGLAAEFELLEEMGVEVTLEGNVLRASGHGPLRPLSVVVSSTGIFSDSHPFFTLLLTRATGASRIVDRVWPHRYEYAQQCAKLGARIRGRPGLVEIEPGSAWRSGLHVHASDLRAAAVLALAALGISGTTMLSGAGHLDRGYSNFVGTLASLGADIAVVAE